jgi:GNAT superfamily N-acetyltransferase
MKLLGASSEKHFEPALSVKRACMNITLLKPGDEAQLIEAAQCLNDDEISRERAAALLNESSFFAVVARTEEGALMGRIYGHVLHRFTQTDLLLYEVDVVDAHQRKGAARAMLEFVKQLCLERGYAEMWVLTESDNAPARALYEAAGGVEENSPTIMYVFYPHK